MADGSELRPEGRFHPRIHAFFASRWWSLLAKKPCRVVFDSEKDIEGGKQYIFILGPHGVLSLCHSLLYSAPEFLARSPAADRRALSARPLFMIPILRDILLACGFIDASKATAVKALKSGYSMTIIPGGEMEQLESRVGQERLYVKKRKGFCRLALEHNVPLVPCYAFGENDLMYTSSLLLGLRRFIASRLYVAIPFAWGGRWWAPFLPRRDVVLTVVVGKPIYPAPTGSDASGVPATAVDALHEKYISEVEALYEKHKAHYGDSTRALAVV